MLHINPARLTCSPFSSRISWITRARLNSVRPALAIRSMSMDTKIPTYASLHAMPKDDLIDHYLSERMGRMQDCTELYDQIDTLHNELAMCINEKRIVDQQLQSLTVKHKALQIEYGNLKNKFNLRSVIEQIASSNDPQLPGVQRNLDEISKTPGFRACVKAVAASRNLREEDILESCKGIYAVLSNHSPIGSSSELVIDTSTDPEVGTK